MTNERTSGDREQILVDFGDAMPFGPHARWVDENDCQYYENPEKTYGDYLKMKQLQDETSQKSKETLTNLDWLRRN